MKLNTNHLSNTSDRVLEDMKRAEEIAKQQFATIDFEHILNQQQLAFESVANALTAKPLWMKALKDACKQGEQLFSQLEAGTIAAAQLTFEPFNHFQQIASQAEEIFKQTTIAWSSQLNNVQDAFQESIAASLKNIDFQELFDQYQRYADLFEHVDFDKLHVATDGAVTYDGVIVDLDEADSVVNDLVISEPGEYLDIHHVLEFLSVKLQTLVTPVRAGLTILLYNIIGGLIASYIFFQISNTSAQPEKVSQEEFRTLKKELQATALLNETTGTHFVKRTYLRVYANPNQQSERIDVIFFEKQVTVFGRKSTWAY